MKEQINKAIEFLKKQDVDACITGSSLLGYYEGQDIDIFCYSESSFTELYYAMYHSPMFTILDPTEIWKSDKFRKEEKSYKKFGLKTLKMKFNTCVDVNIILKQKCTDIFSVLKSFDLDIITRGYDLKTKQYLDLSENLPNNKVTWNKWNIAFHDQNVWEISRVLRQLSRCFKYYKRGYNTDEVVLKYIEMIDDLKEHENIFKSDKVESLLKIMNNNYDIVKKICLEWLKTHEITDKQIDLLNEKVRKI